MNHDFIEFSLFDELQLVCDHKTMYISISGSCWLIPCLTKRHNDTLPEARIVHVGNYVFPLMLILYPP